MKVVRLILMGVVTISTIWIMNSLIQTSENEEANIHKELGVDKYLTSELILPYERYEEFQQEVSKTKFENEKYVKLTKLALIEQQKIEKEKARKVELKKKRLAKIEANKKKPVVISRGSNNNTYDSDWMTFEASYYTSGCYKCSGVTASGYSVKNTIHYNGYRIIATDKNVIPMFSLVEVVTPYETFKAVALDTGGAIKKFKVDILVSSIDEAYRLGRHEVKIRVIKYGGK